MITKKPLDAGICSDFYAGNRARQLAFLSFYGGNPNHLPIDVANRLNRRRARRKTKKKPLNGAAAR